jgi:peptidylprolyl isomerase
MALPAMGKLSNQRTQFKGIKMAQAQNGDTVKVHYTGTLDDGTVFDTSVGRDPLEFTLGERQVIPGFEQAIVGMTPGESKTAEIPADEAYGPHNKEMVVSVDRSDFPNNIEPKVGQMLQLHQPSGQRIAVTVTEVSESSVTLDANHPLAGKDLTFDIQLVEIM